MVCIILSIDAFMIFEFTKIIIVVVIATRMIKIERRMSVSN